MSRGVAILAKQASLSSLRLHGCKRVRIPSAAENRHGQVDLSFWKGPPAKDPSLAARISGSLRDMTSCLKRYNSSPA